MAMKLIDEIKEVACRTAEADAIRAKTGGTAHIPYDFQNGKGFSEAIAEITSGGGSSSKPSVSNGVNFIDYDGRIVETWTNGEIESKTELPANPDHSSDITWAGKTIPLTSEGWNFTLARIKAQFTANPSGCLYVGQTYHTTDGKLYMCVTMHEGRLNPASRFTITNGTATIDWGDGTTPVAAVSDADNEHTYANGGDYLIAITPSDGAEIDISADATSACYLLQKPNNTTLNSEKVYQNCIKRVFLPSSLTSIGDYAFYYCSGLSSVTIPSSVTSIGGGVFYYCLILSSVAIPSSVTSIEEHMFNGCYGLSSVTIPSYVTSIAKYVFSNCSGLSSVTIPSSVTSIANRMFINCSCLSSVSIPSSVTSIEEYAFSSCYGLGSIRFESTTPPSVVNSNAFNNLPTDCIVYVPAASLNVYKEATNYPNPFTYTYIGY